MKIIIFKLYKLIGLPIDILRYYGLFPFVFKIEKNSSQIDKFIKNEILNSEIYFEYGSGFTTFFALKNKKLIRSVEMDNYFYRFLKCKQIKLIDFGFNSIPSTPHFFFFKKFFIKKKIIKYIKFFDLYISRLENKKITLFIDGRFRLSILINLFTIKNRKIKIILDDYKNYNLNDILKMYNCEIINDRYLVIISKKKITKTELEILKKKYFYDFK